VGAPWVFGFDQGIERVLVRLWHLGRDRDGKAEPGKARAGDEYKKRLLRVNAPGKIGQALGNQVSSRIDA